MLQAAFRFYHQLNDFLAPDRKEQVFSYRFESDQTVKHLVEALGVPHPEVGRMAAGGQPITFSYFPQNGDFIEVYPPVIYGRGLIGSDQLRPPVEPRFIVDNHLGRLAVYLRMLGFDTLYRNDYQDEELSQVSDNENRILLTRDRRLLMRNTVTYGYWVRSKQPSQQLLELAQRFQLNEAIFPFKRCMRCNGILQPVAKEVILDRLQPLTRQYYNEFHICPDCQQIYWRGSHYERMQKLVEQVGKGDHKL